MINCLWEPFKRNEQILWIEQKERKDTNYKNDFANVLNHDVKNAFNIISRNNAFCLYKDCT